MGLKIHNEKVTPETAAALRDICPFGAIEYNNSQLSVNGGCKSCKICVRKGPAGVMTWEDEPSPRSGVDKSLWRGIAVYGEMQNGRLHPVTLELIGKARSLAAVTGHPVYAVLVGSGLDATAEEVLHYGVDSVFVYDDEVFENVMISPYTAALYDFITRRRPSSVLVGATSWGRSLAPRVAARCGTGLTADCTLLEMKENTDLVQIRPAFGGNIMAQIVTPAHRPQFCTVRYKIFSAPARSDSASGSIVKMAVTPEMRRSGTEVLEVSPKPAVTDISDAEIIVACGRGFSKEADLAPAAELAELLGGQLAGTRPLVEKGWLDPRRQIGLSGRTVKPKLIITLGISGSVQFAAGMKNSDLIIAVNRDPAAAIFDIAHVCIEGDMYEILPQLIAKIKEARHGSI